MKRHTRLVAACLCLCLLAVGCRGTETEFDPNHEIGVTTREKGSGTRQAFIELFGIQEEYDAGILVDHTTLDAVETNSTAVMMTTIADDRYAIGYLSLGSLNDTVKPVSIGGVLPSAETVRDGSYPVARAFSLVSHTTRSDATEDFLRYVLSREGQGVISRQGYVEISPKAEGYRDSEARGKVVVSGSSSVAPLLEKLKEAYEAKQDRVKVEINQTSSSAGIASAIDGTADLGMSSRALKPSEEASGVTAAVVAEDGIAVIVNRDCPVGDLTVEQVRSIYIGQTTVWSAFLSR